MKQKLAAGVAGFSGLVGSASAAVPESVTTALTDTAADVATVAGLAFAIFLVVVGFRYMKSGAR